MLQSTAPSEPPLTLSHSTTTVPLNFFGSVGRTTTMRLAYGAVAAATAFHFPSGVAAPASVYDEAVPEKKNSSVA
jgi:hypothetical protein